MPTDKIIDLERYLSEFDGAVALMLEAQGVEGDDHYVLLTLAADAWRSARLAYRLSDNCLGQVPVSDLEIEHMAEAGVVARTFSEMLVVYTEASLALVRRAQRILAATPLPQEEPCAA